MTEPQISVCILAGHGARHLEACLQSLSHQTGAPSFELLVGGNPGGAARHIIRRYFPAAEVCETGSRLPGAARNLLVERARGRMLLFLDDDTTAPPDLLATLAELAARHPDAAVFGGPNDTPPGSSRFEFIQGAVLSSLVGSGPVSRRYGARHAGSADERWFTLCNLAVRREAMLPFVNQLVCAEENALLQELSVRGARMRYDPALRVFHTRRPDLGSFARQMFKYGRGRGQLMARRPGTARVAYLLPSLLLLYTILAAATSALDVVTPFCLVPLGLYLALVVATAIRIGWVLRRPSAIATAALLLLTLHVMYGAGVAAGLWRPRRQRAEASVPWRIARDHGLVAGSDERQARQTG